MRPGDSWPPDECKLHQAEDSTAQNAPRLVAPKYVACSQATHALFMRAAIEPQAMQESTRISLALCRFVRREVHNNYLKQH